LSVTELEKVPEEDATATPSKYTVPTSSNADCTTYTPVNGIDIVVDTSRV
jgi:hypothetical protein